MNLSARTLRLAACGIAALALTGCSSMTVSSYLERGSDFSRYRTYGWDKADTLETGDSRLDNNPFFHERIRSDVEKQLATRGFEKTTAGVPDLLVRYHASVDQKLDLNGVDQQAGYCNDSDGCGPYVYEAGTLLVDLVDSRTHELVWRGWAEQTVDGIIDNQRLLEERIDKAITRIMQRVPGRL